MPRRNPLHRLLFSCRLTPCCAASLRSGGSSGENALVYIPPRLPFSPFFLACVQNYSLILDVVAVLVALGVQEDGVREGGCLLLEADGRGHALHLCALRRRMALERDVAAWLVDSQAAAQGMAPDDPTTFLFVSLQSYLCAIISDALCSVFWSLLSGLQGHLVSLHVGDSFLYVLFQLIFFKHNSISAVIV